MAIGLFPDWWPRTDAYERFIKALEWPMALLALAVVPALLLDDGASTPQIHLVAIAINWAVRLAFTAEFALRAAVAPESPSIPSTLMARPPNHCGLLALRCP
jgi:hypothetical protein